MSAIRKCAPSAFVLARSKRTSLASRALKTVMFLMFENVDESLRLPVFISLSIALVFTTVIAASRVADDVGFWMLLAALCWTVTLQIVASQLAQLKETKRLSYLIVANTRELAVIATLVLIFYSVCALIISWWPLNSATLWDLRTWDARTESTHEALKVLAFSKWQLISISALFWALRLIERRYSRQEHLTRKAYGVFKSVCRWIERLSLAGTMCVSLTFLGTGTDGPVAQRIRVETRDIKKQYYNFEREVEKQVDMEARRQILARAWSQRSPELRYTMQISARMISRLRKLEFEESNFKEGNKSIFEIRPDYEFPRSEEYPEPELTQGEVPSSTSKNDLINDLEEIQGNLADRQAVSEVGASEAGSDEAEKIFEELEPETRLTESSVIFEEIDQHYPLFGEFLDIPAKTLHEFAAKNVSRIAREVCAAWRGGSGKSLWDIIREKTSKSLETDTPKFVAEKGASPSSYRNLANLDLDIQHEESLIAKAMKESLSRWGKRNRLSDEARSILEELENQRRMAPEEKQRIESEIKDLDEREAEIRLQGDFETAVESSGKQFQKIMTDVAEIAERIEE